MVLENLVLTIISILIFYSVINYVAKKDIEIKISKLEYMTVLAIYLFGVFIYLNLYGLNTTFLFKYIVLIYLVITAFIDFKTKYVYCFLNKIMGIISILYIVYIYRENLVSIDFIYSLSVAIIVSILFSILKFWGEGDTEIFIVTAPFIAIYGVEYVIINFFLAISLSGILNLIAIMGKKVKLEYRVAFAPFIAVSTLFILLV